MRYSSPLLMAVLAFTAACSDDSVPSGPVDPGAPSLAAAVTHEVRVNEPFDLLVFNDCAGEDVLLSGVAHDVYHVTINGNRVVTLDGHNQFHLSGRGLTTGDQYESTQSVSFVTSGSLVNGQFSTTFVGHAELVGPGPGNNEYFPATFHLTVNAKGEVTSEVAFGDVVCR